jgi:hypothetical protein
MQTPHDNMPFQSEKQRRFMWAKKPKIARRWKEEGKGDVEKMTPINIAMRLLKHATSPEALRHKVAYDEKFQSTPERVKYREELNRERRKRGIMGRGGPDISHTREHTLVEEDPHTNRARHFAERGTLKAINESWNMLKKRADPISAAYHKERNAKMKELAEQYVQRMRNEGTPEKGLVFPRNMAGMGWTEEEKAAIEGVPIKFGHIPTDSPEWAALSEWKRNRPVAVQATIPIETELATNGEHLQNGQE